MYVNNDFIPYLDGVMHSLIEYGNVDPTTSVYINDMTEYLLNNTWEGNDMEYARFVLEYSNIIWENLDSDRLPLENGVYDILREKYISYGGVPPVGGVPVKKPMNDTQIVENQIVDYIEPAVFLNDILNDEDLLYTDLLLHRAPITINDMRKVPALFANNISKRTRTASHEYPNLVGTLNKCKFVMKYQAQEKGVLNDANVKVLERDFFGDHIARGILDPNRVFSMILMLKFDGVSVEGDVVNSVFTSRGDALGGVAADLTPIMRNYHFPYKPSHLDEAFGVQFEAIMTYSNLHRYNQVKNYNYKNCRTAISGLFSSSDAWKYMDYVTLVPLASSLDIPKDVELEFLNRYFTKGVHNAYTVITGNVTTILYQIKKFVEEAEMARDFIDFQYDGVVVQYLDEDLIKALGRSNAINNYAMAIKFSPLKKQTIFTGYTYTVGQDGYITPMIHYRPVEFMGTIHNKSSGHSLDRFFELGLCIGDIIDVEYVNDVMPYVTKPENSFNDENSTTIGPVEFPTQCPVCGSTITISKTGRSAYCPNIGCDGRRLARVVNMVAKLDLRDIAEANVEKLNVYTFHDMMELEYDYVCKALNSDILASKFMVQIEALKESHAWDYEILGSLGFDSLAEETWKLILRNIPLTDVVNLPDDELYNKLINIKGIGPTKAKVVVERREFFIDDIMYIIDKMKNIRSSFGYKCEGKKIRFTGFRDKELVDLVTELGHDMNDKSVTRDTDMLIVVDEEAINTSPSSKVKNAQKYGVPIIILNDFIANMNVYLES